ncbi:penicillin-binding protein [Paenibacillus sp. 598K]|uniref:serine hydrolase domain-containing protein n=1 Tax=Paenibacillus sp. 598K TaxID=1117987 RepID=UPI000FF99E0B|nr:serine hydrolase [Paenibacillus sp. 598K]GBF76381.1 penicillin-binding protein [Paenibacillus sp. 598K]
MITEQRIDDIVRSYNEEEGQVLKFSGTILLATEHQVPAAKSYGYANRSERIANTPHTRFGIASGCKIFTAIAICQLIEQGRLALDTRLSELELPLPQVHPEMTVRHLLTHTSGIPDYFDEAVMTDYESLWQTLPMYTIDGPGRFLPLFADQPMKFEPGAEFAYNNAGYIVLGLIVEQLSGRRFADYIQDEVFASCGMEDSGYFRMDRLPERTALGYVGEDDDWRTNIYSIPVLGGPDGGAYTTAHDLRKFWAALMEGRLLSPEMTAELLRPQVETDEEGLYYGYGVWMTQLDGEVFKYFVMGFDPGVCMLSSYYPALRAEAHVLANIDSGAGWIASDLDEQLRQAIG